MLQSNTRSIGELWLPVIWLSLWTHTGSRMHTVLYIVSNGLDTPKHTHFHLLQTTGDLNKFANLFKKEKNFTYSCIIYTKKKDQKCIRRHWHLSSCQWPKYGQFLFPSFCLSAFLKMSILNRHHRCKKILVSLHYFQNEEKSCSNFFGGEGCLFTKNLCYI